MKQLVHSENIFTLVEDAKKAMQQDQDKESTTSALHYCDIELVVSYSTGIIVIEGVQSGFYYKEETCYVLGKTEDGYFVIIREPVGIINGMDWVDIKKMEAQALTEEEYAEW